MNRFTAYELRAHDVEAARHFYTALLGHEDLRITPLPERARAAGAPAHWLGHLGVEDDEATIEALLSRGGEKRGPAIRAPGGEMVAVDVAPAEGDDRCVWHELHALDADASWKLYSELFGWRETGRHDIEGVGSYRTFGWGTFRSVGGMASTAGRPGRHVHWLFYFGVKDLDATLAKARQLGARSIIGPHVFPGSGKRSAALEDAQGAAFGLREL